MNTGHLTDEQFSDLIAGELPNDAAATHLGECAHCRGELEAVRASMTDFNSVSMAWAQVEAPHRVQTPSRWLVRLGSRPSWGLGFVTMAAACLIAVGIQHPFAHPAQAPATIASSEPSTAEIADDNRLMASINQELEYDAQPAVPVSDLKPGDRHARHTAEGVVTN